MKISVGDIVEIPSDTYFGLFDYKLKTGHYQVKGITERVKNLIKFELQPVEGVLRVSKSFWIESEELREAMEGKVRVAYPRKLESSEI